MSPYSDIVAYMKRADLYKKLGQYNKAIIDYSKVIQIKPIFVMSYMSRGECYRALGNYQQAEADVGKATQIMFRRR